MFLDNFRGDSRELQGYLKEVSRVLESVKCVSKKMIQECFNEVLFCDFVVAWILSQLPKQKDLFFIKMLF